jgi:DNA-binding MarR family transcriptional regulator
MLGQLSRGSTKLIESLETPDSGREKMLRLTPAGLEFIDRMTESASNFLAECLGHVSLPEQRAGLEFLDHAFNTFGTQ